MTNCARSCSLLIELLQHCGELERVLLSRAESDRDRGEKIGERAQESLCSSLGLRLLAQHRERLLLAHWGALPKRCSAHMGNASAGARGAPCRVTARVACHLRELDHVRCRLRSSLLEGYLSRLESLEQGQQDSIKALHGAE